MKKSFMLFCAILFCFFSAAGEARKDGFKRPRMRRYRISTRGKVEFRRVKKVLTTEEAERYRHDPHCMTERCAGSGCQEAIRTYLLESSPVLIAGNFKDVRWFRDEMSGQIQIILYFNPADAARFAQITRENKGRQLAVIVHGKLYCAPVIMEEITNGSASISGIASEEEARKIVNFLIMSRIL